MERAQPSTPAQDVDLTNCDREPIHALGRVQSYGALLAVSSDWIVLHASENISDYLGHAAADIIGTPAVDVLTGELMHDIRSQLQLLMSADSVERLFQRSLKGRDTPVDIAVHRSGHSYIIEFENSDPGGPKDYMSVVRPMIDRLSSADDMDVFFQRAARQLHALIGFDRVMVYRFAEDESGVVVGEDLRPGMEPYLGLRYPASDIPKQARALYTRSLLRIISDANDDGYAIVPNATPEGEALDLSISSTRAVSPIHREYLRNMGVQASMSVSILRRGKLWGLFACHHRSPIVLPYSTRTAAELFGQLFSFVLEQKEGDLEHEERKIAQEVHHQLMARIGGGGSVASHFDTIVDTIGTVISFDGAAGWIGGEYMTRGSTPTQAQFTELARFLNTSKPNQVFSTDEIGQKYPDAARFGAEAVGVLALPVSRSPRDYIVLFRREIAQKVVWAGNPDKPVQSGPGGTRLTPRKSFEAWQQIVRGRSAPWSRTEIAAAEALRVTLLEAVLKLTDEALTARSKTNERQELLIAELNHRVRNILNLVRGLISQSEGDAKSARELTEVISGRIHSLARAHDQITQGSASALSFHDLLEVEGEAYVGNGGQNIVLEGPNAALDPLAFSTLALVMHELMTNAVKYGALSGDTGRVTIATTQAHDGSYEINWREEGGPSIQPDERKRGFGSTLIERSIPHDLNGEADVRLETTGLQARFVIPARFVSDAPTIVASSPLSGDGDASPNAAFLENILVVEDNMVIALDVEDMLTDVGAVKVSIASSTRDALTIIEVRRPSFALLDVNLLSETSEAVAAKLSEIGVPFAFATGYGEDAELAQRFPEARTLTKPFGRKALLSVLSD